MGIKQQKKKLKQKSDVSFNQFNWNRKKRFTGFDLSVQILNVAIETIFLF